MRDYTSKMLRDGHRAMEHQRQTAKEARRRSLRRLLGETGINTVEDPVERLRTALGLL